MASTGATIAGDSTKVVVFGFDSCIVSLKQTSLQGLSRGHCVCHLPSRSVVFGHKLVLSEHAKEYEYGGSDGKVDADRYHKAFEALRHVVDLDCACGTAAPQ